jgi:hypothetical protein
MLVDRMQSWESANLSLSIFRDFDRFGASFQRMSMRGLQDGTHLDRHFPSVQPCLKLSEQAMVERTAV